MKYTNKHNIPDHIVRALTRWNEKYSKGGADYSVTGLIRPAHMAHLERVHADEICEDVSDLFYRVWGTATHAMLADGHEDALQEIRFFDKIEVSPTTTVTVSGQADVITKDGDLLDTKTTSAASMLYGDVECPVVGSDRRYRISSDWVAQVNCYAYLAKNGMGTMELENEDEPVIVPKERIPEIKRLGIAVALRDWSKTKAGFDPNYPHAPCFVLIVPMWPETVQAAYIRDRIYAHLTPEDDCNPMERWARKDHWTIEVNGKPWNRGKKFYEHAAAEVQAAEVGGTVYEHPGECVRCKGYCTVSQFCEPNKIRGGGLGQMEE